MTTRRLTRIVGGIAGLMLSAAIVWPIAHFGILNGKPNTIPVATCDCSTCRSDQVCCKTANGACGCFPKGISC
jgi:hypothetical protein